MEALTTLANGREGVLPVFGFGEEAQMFIDLTALEDGWRARRTSAAEIVSLLYEPRSGVTGVALDPVPLFDPDADAFFGRREFVSFLSEKQKTWFSGEKTLWDERFLVPADHSPGPPAEPV